MSFTLEILSAADGEHARTIEWLVEHTSNEELDAYIAAISRALDEILERPFAWPSWRSHPELHVRHLREISYSIFYRVRGRVVLVVAFAHMSRRAGYWLDRL